MEELQQISTETWKLLVPAEWSDPQVEESGALYFLAPDETKGFYIATWRCNPGNYNHRNKDAINHFRSVERESLDEMEDNQWRTICDDISADEANCTSIIDSYDEGSCYRIVSKIIASLPWVVRFSFHDYLCEDYGISKAFTDEIVSSLEFHAEKGA